MAGAPGFEPGNGGTKNRCLTAWRRPNLRCLLERVAAARNSGSSCPGGRHRQRAALTGARGWGLAEKDRAPLSLAVALRRAAGYKPATS